MGNYSVKGLYAGYDKKNKERDALDYYATPQKEVENILSEVRINFNNSSILEPCVGGGHMMEGILQHIKGWHYNNIDIIGTDIKNRGYTSKIIPMEDLTIEYGLDYMADDYPHNDIDYIIMNPPFSLLEPFVIRSLDIAKKGILMLARLQFLEGEKRYEKILRDNPPTDVYVYVDRIACYKNGDFSKKPDAIQAYAWFYWDLTEECKYITPKLHWIRRADKY